MPTFQNIVPSGVNLTNTGSGYSYYDDPTKGRTWYLTDPQGTYNKIMSDPSLVTQWFTQVLGGSAQYDPSYAAPGVDVWTKGINPSNPNFGLFGQYNYDYLNYLQSSGQPLWDPTYSAGQTSEAAWQAKLPSDYLNNLFNQQTARTEANLGGMFTGNTAQDLMTGAKIGASLLGGVNALSTGTTADFATSQVEKQVTSNILSNALGGSASQIKPNISGSIPQQGGGMAGISDALGNITLGNLAGLGTGVADYATTSKQQDIMSGAYGQAQNLIMQPSPEQAAIRSQVMNLIQSPGSFFQDPLYQAAFGQGQQALERSQSSRGVLGSGQAATELQKYGQTFGSDMYNQRLAQLSGLSGISQDPLIRQIGAQTLLGGAGMQADMLGNKVGALGQGINSFLGTNPNSILQSLMSGGTGTSGLGGVSLSDAWTNLQNMLGLGTDYTSTSAFSGLTPMGDTSSLLSDASSYMPSIDTSSYISSLLGG